MAMRSCLVVLVGAETSERKWVKYEIERAMKLHKGIVGIRIHKLENKDGKQDVEGLNPFYAVITPLGHRLSNYVTVFDSTYRTSKYVYDDISKNIERLIEEAIANRWSY
jgi:hypothetical protein